MLVGVFSNLVLNLFLVSERFMHICFCIECHVSNVTIECHVSNATIEWLVNLEVEGSD